MTERELERWTELVVGEARGVPASEASRDERRRIEREQPELSAQASLWAEFAELDQPRAGERDDDELIAAVLGSARGAPERDEPRVSDAEAPRSTQLATRPRSKVVGLALGLSALAACLALGLVLERLLSEVPEASGRVDAPRHGAAMSHDEPAPLRRAEVGEHALGEGECRRAAGSTRVCTHERVRFRVPAPSPDAPALELEAGQLRVDASDEPEGIAIATPAGRVWTRGVIELRFDPIVGELHVEVVSGEAELIGTHAAPVRLGLGATLSLLATSEPLPALEPGPPAAALPEPAQVETPELAPPASRPTSSTEPETPEPSAPASADELLAAAQSALAAGDTGEAIARYGALIDAHPDSRAAAAASVSLGRLLLREGRAAEALAAFERYLEGSATELREEARYGRIRALRALGRSDELDAAIAEFLAAHPHSIHRDRLEP